VGVGGADGWRDAHLVEYFATDGALSPTAHQISEHLVDMANNTFIGLRIINSTHNWAYFEFSNVVTDWAFAHTEFCELYGALTFTLPSCG
jgi:hypothetical protein